MITKAVVQSINSTGTRCVIRMPLFETASSSTPVIAEALVNITPGVFNNIEVDDVVFVGFEENAIEKPIILGKLFKGAQTESEIRGGGGIFDTIKVTTTATLPATTNYSFPNSAGNGYQNLKSPINQADYILWLELLAKDNLNALGDNFSSLQSWMRWKFRPENIEIDDGDLDLNTETSEPFLYQDEGGKCELCEKACTRNKKRTYLKLPVDKNYPDI